MFAICFEQSVCIVILYFSSTNICPTVYNVFISVSSHHGQKIKRSSDWDSMIEHLVKARVEDCTPATDICIRCGDRCENIILCLDCGPVTYLCDECFIAHHRIMAPHFTRKWDNTVSNIYFIIINYHL